jgi:hypothetical protein
MGKETVNTRFAETSLAAIARRRSARDQNELIGPAA